MVHLANRPFAKPPILFIYGQAGIEFSYILSLLRVQSNFWNGVLIYEKAT